MPLRVAVLVGNWYGCPYRIYWYRAGARRLDRPARPARRPRRRPRVPRPGPRGRRGARRHDWPHGACRALPLATHRGAGLRRAASGVRGTRGTPSRIGIAIPIAHAGDANGG
jgi:hypothetical protein